MAALKIRRATLRDLDVLVEHRRKMFEEIPRYHGCSAEAHDVGDRAYRRWVRRQMRAGTFVAWIVATNSGEAAAGGAVWLQEQQPRPGDPGRRAPYLLSMYTKPEYRGRGLGTRIVREAMRWAKSRGYPRVTLHASPMGRGVYERLGWKRTWEMRLDL